MKTLSIATILVLLATTTWFGVKNVETERTLQIVSDTLYSLRSQQENLLFRDKAMIFQKIAEPNLEVNDSMVETHRISAFYGRMNYTLRLVVKPDSSIHAVLKQYTRKNPLTGEGEDVLLKVSDPKISFAVFQQFKDKLYLIKFPEAAIDVDYICCFGGTFLWEAAAQPSKKYRFRTHCHQPTQFTEACIFLLRAANDSDLNQRLY
ncbi:MAG TPA: hypothetical protein PK228_18190 [Saprospiraceae bacterium]|nr:hypothetical protein [Saprospiraceae bacterium]